MEDRPEELLQKEAQIGRDVKHERKVKIHGRDQESNIPLIRVPGIRKSEN